MLHTPSLLPRLSGESNVQHDNRKKSAFICVFCVVCVPQTDKLLFNCVFPGSLLPKKVHINYPISTLYSLQSCFTSRQWLSELSKIPLYLYILYVLMGGPKQIFTNTVCAAFERRNVPLSFTYILRYWMDEKKRSRQEKNAFLRKDCRLTLNFLPRMFGIHFKSLYLHSASIRNVKARGKWLERVLTPLEIKKTK